MRAADLAEQIPTVRGETTGAEAARIMAEYRMHGLVVMDDTGQPKAVIPGSQLLGMVLPPYLIDDPNLAHVFDEAGADELCHQLNTTTIADLVASKQLHAHELPTVLPEDTLIELAAIMSSRRYPLVIVRDRDGKYGGVVLLSRVLAAIAQAAGQGSDLMQRRLERDLVLRGLDTGNLPAELPDGIPDHVVNELNDRDPNA